MGNLRVWKLFSVAMMLILILQIGILTISSGTALADNPSTPTTTTPPAPPIVEKVTSYKSQKYSDPTYKFSVAYPEVWTSAPATLSGSVFYAKGPGKDVVYIAVRPATNFKEASNTFLVDLITSSGAAFSPSVDNEFTITLADGTEADVILLSAAFGMAKAAITGVIKDGNAIMVLGASDPMNMALYQEIGSTLIVTGLPTPTPTPTLPNRPPIINGITFTKPGNTPVMITPNHTAPAIGCRKYTTIDIACLASDPDNDNLNYTWRGSGGKIIGTGSQIQWLAAGDPGNYTITVTVSDGKDASTNFSIMVSVYCCSDGPPSPVPPPTSNPAINSFTASPSSITAGSTAMLTWSTTNATGARINGTDVAVNGSQAVNPSSTITYLLEATNGSNSTSATTVVIVNVTAVPPLPVEGQGCTVDGSANDNCGVTVTLTPNSGPTGTPVTIFIESGTYPLDGNYAIWWSKTPNMSSDDPTAVKLTEGWNERLKQSISVSLSVPAASAGTNYFHYIKSGHSSQMLNFAFTVTVTANPPPPTSYPVINSFTASPSSVHAGDSSILTWSISNATSITIDNGIGAVSSAGSRTIIPATTTTYTLLASHGANTVAQTVMVNVTVTPPPTPPTPPTPPIPPSTGTSLVATSITTTPNSVVQVPIVLNDASNIGSMNFVLTYNPQVLKVNKIDTGALLSGALFMTNYKAPPLVRFGLTTSDGITGSGTMAYIEFQVIGTAGSNSALTFSALSIKNTSGQAVTVTSQSGMVTVATDGKVKGDYNGDGKVTIVDVMAALKMSIQLLPEDLILDMDGDGAVTAEDAQLILKIALGK